VRHDRPLAAAVMSTPRRAAHVDRNGPASGTASVRRG